MREYLNALATAPNGFDADARRLLFRAFRALPLAAPPFLMAADLPDDAWGVCADSLLPHELCCLARVSQGLKRAITSCRAYRYLRPFTLMGHAGAVLSVAVKPGGTIVSGSADGWLKEWTVAGMQATCQDIVRQARKIISVAALPDGRIVSGNQHSQLMLADKAAVPVNRRFPDTHGRSIYGVAVRHDGSVVSVGLNDGDAWEGGITQSLHSRSGMWPRGAAADL